MEYGSRTQGHSSTVGMKYRIHSSQPLYDVNTDYVPCALYYVATRATVLMIPAKVNCLTGWIVEYTGYLMGERLSQRYSRKDIKRGFRGSVTCFPYIIYRVHASTYMCVTVCV